MDESEELRQKAAHWRGLAEKMTDQRDADELNEVAASLDRIAAAISRKKTEATTGET